MGPKTVHGGVFGVEGGRDTLGLGLPALLDNLPFTRQFCSPNPQTFYIRYWRNYIYWTLVLYLLKRAARTPPGLIVRRKLACLLYVFACVFFEKCRNMLMRIYSKKTQVKHKEQTSQLATYN
jgi:hypothetical protein